MEELIKKLLLLIFVSFPTVSFAEKSPWAMGPDELYVALSSEVITNVKLMLNEKKVKLKRLYRKDAQSTAVLYSTLCDRFLLRGQK